jgi:hypothetical protein
LQLHTKVLFFLEEIGKVDVERSDVVLVDLELGVLLLNLELGLAIEDVGVVRQGQALEFEDKLLFLVDVFGLETYLDLLFLFWLEVVCTAVSIIVVFIIHIPLNPIDPLPRLLPIHKPPRLICWIVMVIHHHCVNPRYVSSID